MIIDNNAHLLANMYTNNSWFLSLQLHYDITKELIVQWHMSLASSAKLRRIRLKMTG
jgi:hypothetical protein